MRRRMRTVRTGSRREMGIDILDCFSSHILVLHIENLNFEMATWPTYKNSVGSHWVSKGM